MVQSKVIVRDLGMKEVMRGLQKAGGIHVTVGVHGDARPRQGGGPTMVQIASAHEFGTPTIPERSFIRLTLDLRRKQIADIAEVTMRRVADRKLDARTAAEIIGTFVANAIKKTISDTEPTWPELQASTIARKGSSKPLIDTGQLRAAITHKVIEGKAPPKGSG